MSVSSAAHRGRHGAHVPHRPHFIAGLVVALALVVPIAAVAGPTDDKIETRIVVDLRPAPGTRTWLASAFEQALARELSGFERLTPVAKEDFRTRDCVQPEAVNCRLGVYRRAHVDIVMFGRVDDDEIAYELYQTWTPARLASGSIAIGRGQTPIGLKHATRAALHPVLKHGGLLDQRPYMPSADSTAAAASWTAFDPALVLAALAIAMLPFAWFALVRTRSSHRVLALRTLRSTAIVAGVLVALGALAAIYGSFAELVTAWPWVFGAAGGLAWGAIVILGVRGVAPALDGLTRVALQDLWRMLRAWLALVVLRFALLVVLYLPIIALALVLADWLAMPSPWGGILFVPATGFFARAWLASWIEVIAARLDDRYVDGEASPANPRSREIAEYVTGYIRRTGWDVDPALLARTVFLPGKLDGIATYGGGATHARIVIDTSLLALAMGAPAEVLPDDKPAAVFPDWTAASVVRSADHPRVDTPIPEYHARKPRTTLHRKPLGRAATLLGYVIPSPGQAVPLISDNPRDLAVVRALLSEHYPWDAPDPDDEFDTTDPTDKDFLFGALVRELGVVQRGDCQLTTIKLLAGLRLGRLATGISTRIADTFTALNFGRHHFIQYLYYRWSTSADLLTARARPGRLLDTSIKMMEAARESPRKRSRSLRRRLIWLSWFVGEPIVDVAEVRVRRIATAGAVVAAVVALGLVAKRAFDYHPIYVDRIESQHRAIEKRERERKQQEGSAHGEIPQESQ